MHLERRKLRKMHELINDEENPLLVQGDWGGCWKVRRR